MLIKCKLVVPEPGAAKSFPILDQSTLQSTHVLQHNLSHHAATDQAVPGIDVNLFNFSWDPNVPTEEAALGVMTGGLLGGQHGVDNGPSANPFIQNHHKVVPDTYPSPVSNIRLSPPSTISLARDSSPLSPSSRTQSTTQNQAWIHRLAQINVDLYLQHMALTQSLARQRNIDAGVGRVTGHNRSSSMESVDAPHQFCIGHTFDLMHRFLQLLEEASSITRSSLDRGSILLVLSCYHRLVEIYGSFFRSPNLGRTVTSPELSAHIKHSPFLMGQFELSTSSPLYTSLVVSLADFMLLKCRDAVNSLNGGTAIHSVTLTPPQCKGGVKEADSVMRQSQKTIQNS